LAEKGETKIIGTVTGRIRRPAPIAEQPRTSCRYCGWKKHHRPVGADQGEGGGAGAEIGPVAEKREVDDRLWRAMLDPPEAVQRGEPEDRQGGDRRSAPDPRLDQGENDGRQPGGQRDQAGRVDPPARPRVGRLGRGEGGDRDAEGRDRQVDPEDQPPVEVDEAAADQRAGAEGNGGDAGPDAERPRLLLGGEGVADDRQRERLGTAPRAEGLGATHPETVAQPIVGIGFRRWR
jgi:hypothetical protein